MNKLRIMMITVGLLATFSAAGQKIARSTLSSFGSTSFNADNGVLIRHTVGQPPGTEVFATEQHGILRQGFQQPIDHPSVTSSPLPFFDGHPGKFGFSMFPNPARDQVDIVMSDEVGSFEIQITDIHGKRVYHQKDFISSPVTVNLRMLRSGVYFITVISGNERSTRKLIIL